MFDVKVYIRIFLRNFGGEDLELSYVEAYFPWKINWWIIRRYLKQSFLS